MKNLIGSYVEYKASIYMIVGITGGLAKIIDPRLGNGKLNVSIKNLVTTDYKPAMVVNYRCTDYIVTGKRTIISCKTGRVMLWGELDGNRVSILALVR